MYKFALRKGAGIGEYLKHQFYVTASSLPSFLQKLTVFYKTPGASALTQDNNMLFGEYDYETDIRVQRREAFEDGAEQTKIETAKNLLKEGLSVEQIARCTNLTLEKVQELAKSQLKTLPAHDAGSVLNFNLFPEVCIFF